MKNGVKCVKSNKINKNVIIVLYVISITLNEFRSLGSSEILTENPRVGSSILSLGTSEIKGLAIIS